MRLLMNLTPEQELEIAIMKVNYHKVCDLFELSATDRNSLNCGQWIVNAIKQFQTSYTIARASKLMKSEMDASYTSPPIAAVSTTGETHEKETG